MFCYMLTVQEHGDRHTNTIDLANWLVHVLFDFTTVTSRSFILP